MTAEDLLNAIMANQRSRRMNAEPEPRFVASLEAAEMIVARTMPPVVAAQLTLRHGDAITIRNCQVFIDHNLEGVTLGLLK